MSYPCAIPSQPPQFVHLRYCLGEVPVFRPRFPAVSIAMDWTDPAQERVRYQWEREGIPERVEVGLLRSCPLHEPLAQFALLPDLIRYAPFQYRRYYIDLSGSFQSYLGKFSGKSRSTLQRKIRKFAEFSGGAVCFREYKTPEEVAELHRLGREISKKTYQERLLDAGLPDGDEYRRRLAEMASLDRLRGYVLFEKQEPIAYLVCPVRDGVLIYDHLGYDSAFAKWSPGTILQYLALERIFSEKKFRLFDFTEGGGPHKEFFATGSVFCGDIYYFRKSLRNLSLLYSHAGLESISRSVVKVLGRLHLKSSIKNLIRRKA